MNKNQFHKLIKESVAETLKKTKEKSLDNQIDKAKALLDILHSEIGVYTILAKEIAAQYKEHEYEKLMDEYNRFENIIQIAQDKYDKVETKLKSLESEKKKSK